ncbi:hypothetical protein WG908_06090 [Sphingobium sp. AN641]|uniref:hypothetical protein n=1 Tax=Sphingobium sp. AN641 TaxID=3133443 RepID=UPI0030BA9171
MTLAAVAWLAGCDSEPADGVGGVSASEASALNDAASMLDTRADEALPVDGSVNPAASAAARADRHRANQTGGGQ